MKTLTDKNVNMQIQTQPAPAAEVEPPPSVADRLRQSRIESLKRKQRSDAFIHSLTSEQTSKLIDWIDQFPDLGLVYQRVTAPKPEGFGIKTTLTTLRRFRAHLNSMSSVSGTEEILDTITDMELDADLSQSDRIQHAISHLLHEKAFALARTHPGSTTLKDILTMIDKLVTLEHKRKKLAHLEEKRLHRKQKTSTKKETKHHHRVDLNIISTPAPQPITVPMQQATVTPPAPLPPADAPQLADRPAAVIPLLVVAPLPEVVT
ncbi:MAG: hypothetical protein ACXW32_07580 [Limisphaerales bacterium]